jgi:hypothetical protein
MVKAAELEIVKCGYYKADLPTFPGCVVKKPEWLNGETGKTLKSHA